MAFASKSAAATLWTFRDGLVAKKDSFWKIVEQS